MDEHHITVPRTARYHTLGDARTARSMWIVLHGYGQLARYFLRPFENLAENRFIVAPEGIGRFYLDEAHSRVGATWMTREDREQEIADQVTYLDLLVGKLMPTSGPRIPVRVLGFSQGVSTAARWCTLGTTPTEQLVLWGGGLPPELDAAILSDRWSHLHVDLVHGDNDPLVPISVLAHSEARLNQAGIHHAAHRYQGAHELDKLVLQRLLTV